MEEVRISSKGQLVIPKYIRDALALKPGRAVLIGLQDNRIVIMLKPENPVEALQESGKKIALRSARKDIREE